MKLCSEIILLNGTTVCNFCFAPLTSGTNGTGRGRKQEVTPQIVPFSGSVLAVVVNKAETPTCFLLQRSVFSQTPVGPADCDLYNCNHVLSGEYGEFQ